MSHKKTYLILLLLLSIQIIIQDIEGVSIKTLVNETSEDQTGHLISVNPNPSHGVFTISLLRPALEYRYIKIIDAAGNNILFMDKPIENSFRMDFSQHGGEYFRYSRGRAQC